MTTLPQQETINQYLADGSTTEYSFTYYAPTEEDIDVYITPPGQIANPVADIKVLDTDYTVEFAIDPLTGGTITFIDGAPESTAIVTIVRNVKATITSNFADVQNFNGTNLDNELIRNMLVSQQNETFDLRRTLHYAINSYLPDIVDQVDMPLLDQERAIWMRRNGVITPVVLEENPDVSTLRSELADEQQGADGASIVGYYDISTNTGMTVTDFLHGVGQSSTFGEDVGALNAYQVNITGYDEPPKKGDSLRFMPATTNTTTATIKINNSGTVRNIYAAQGELTTSGNIVAGFVTEIVWDGSNWVIVTPSNSVINRNYYAPDVGTTNAVVLTINGMDSFVNGDRVNFIAAETNTAEATVNINSIGPVDLVRGSPYSNAIAGLNVKDLVRGQSYQMIYENGYWILENPSTVYSVLKGSKLACRIRKSDSTGLPSSVFTKMTFTAVEYDTGGMWNVGNSSFTCVYKGTYRFTVGMFIESTAPVPMVVFSSNLYINSLLHGAIGGGNSYVSGTITFCSGSISVLLNPGDICEIYYYYGGGFISGQTQEGSYGQNFVEIEFLGDYEY